MQIVDYAKLEELAEAARNSFSDAEPYSHIVLDDFLEPDAAEALLKEFDSTSDDWTAYNHYNERKSGLTKLERMGPRTQEIVSELSSPKFLGFLEKLTGIPGLTADPDLDGGGLHEIKRDGFLNIHADFQSHTKRSNWSRQINLLLYLNKNWEDNWGGNLELWDADMTHAVVSVKPEFNRCVMFHTTERSMHGHPAPLDCPEGRSRKSLALYYFRDEGCPQELVSTNYRARPEDPLHKKALIAVDRVLIYAYSFLKRYTPINDRLATRLLRRFSR